MLNALGEYQHVAVMVAVPMGFAGVMAPVASANARYVPRSPSNGFAELHVTFPEIVPVFPEDTAVARGRAGAGPERVLQNRRLVEWVVAGVAGHHPGTNDLRRSHGSEDVEGVLWTRLPPEPDVPVRGIDFQPVDLRPASVHSLHEIERRGPIAVVRGCQAEPWHAATRQVVGTDVDPGRCSATPPSKQL